MNRPTHLPVPLRQYALLADGERGALIGPHGNIAFLCAPRWHDDAVFSSLLGGAGRYAVTPQDPRYVWGGHYETDSLIWRSRWVATGPSSSAARRSPSPATPTGSSCSAGSRPRAATRTSRSSSTAAPSSAPAR